MKRTVKKYKRGNKRTSHQRRKKGGELNAVGKALSADLASLSAIAKTVIDDSEKLLQEVNSKINEYEEKIKKISPAALPAATESVTALRTESDSAIASSASPALTSASPALTSASPALTSASPASPALTSTSPALTSTSPAAVAASSASALPDELEDGSLRESDPQFTSSDFDEDEELDLKDFLKYKDIKKDTDFIRHVVNCQESGTQCYELCKVKNIDSNTWILYYTIYGLSGDQRITPLHTDTEKGNLIYGQLNNGRRFYFKKIDKKDIQQRKNQQLQQQKLRQQELQEHGYQGSQYNHDYRDDQELQRQQSGYQEQQQQQQPQHQQYDGSQSDETIEQRNNGTGWVFIYADDNTQTPLGLYGSDVMRKHYDEGEIKDSDYINRVTNNQLLWNYYYKINEVWDDPNNVFKSIPKESELNVGQVDQANQYPGDGERKLARSGRETDQGQHQLARRGRETGQDQRELERGRQGDMEGELPLARRDRETGQDQRRNRDDKGNEDEEELNIDEIITQSNRLPAYQLEAKEEAQETPATGKRFVNEDDYKKYIVEMHNYIEKDYTTILAETTTRFVGWHSPKYKFYQYFYIAHRALQDLISQSNIHAHTYFNDDITKYKETILSNRSAASVDGLFYLINDKLIPGDKTYKKLYKMESGNQVHSSWLYYMPFGLLTSIKEQMDDYARCYSGESDKNKKFDNFKNSDWVKMPDYLRTAMNNINKEWMAKSQRYCGKISVATKFSRYGITGTNDYKKANDIYNKNTVIPVFSNETWVSQPKILSNYQKLREIENACNQRFWSSRKLAGNTASGYNKCKRILTCKNIIKKDKTGPINGGQRKNLLFDDGEYCNKIELGLGRMLLEIGLILFLAGTSSGVLAAAGSVVTFGLTAALGAVPAAILISLGSFFLQVGFFLRWRRYFFKLLGFSSGINYLRGIKPKGGSKKIRKHRRHNKRSNKRSKK